MKRTNSGPMAALTLVPALALLAGALTAPAGAGPDHPAHDTAARHGSGPGMGTSGGDRPVKTPTAIGYGGAVSSVDADASAAGLEVLRRGGNATDAAVATAAALGVTEPYSAGIGGGGYFVHYSARTGKVQTIDGRETAPAAMPHDAFIDPATGKPYRFTPELVTSGVSVGTPGTPLTWERALRRWGSMDLRTALKPATRLAQRGFTVDQTFRQQTLDNKARFDAFTSTRALFLPGGDAPAVGSRFRNPDLADTYRLLARRGTEAFYQGRLAKEIAQTVQAPPTTADTTLPVPPGHLSTRDLARYRVIEAPATHMTYRGLDVYGMGSSSSGGTTVGEALNILGTADLASMNDTDALHQYLEAGALAFADRARYVGDASYVDVPYAALLDPVYGQERACQITPGRALSKPVAAGGVTDYDGVCATPGAAEATSETDTENISTTNLTVADRWGNVVEYTLTIEQTGGSGIVVPGRGFLLNNELTDFSTVYDPADPNRIEPGKRPRSSMSPTIILRDGKPWLALGSPGGSTIITTVLQMIVNRVDRGMSITEAIAAPRSSPRNGAGVTAEPAFIERYGPGLTGYGHTLVPSGDSFTSASEIGAATAIEFGPRGLMTAVAEPQRRGGGTALVVRPGRR